MRCPDNPNLTAILASSAIAGGLATKVMAECASAVLNGIAEGIIEGVHQKRLHNWETRIEERVCEVDGLLAEILKLFESGVLLANNAQNAFEQYLEYEAECAETLEQASDGYEAYFALTQLVRRLTSTVDLIRLQASLDGIEQLGELQLLEDSADR